MFRIIDEDGQIVGHMQPGDMVVKAASRASAKAKRDEEAANSMPWKPERVFVKLYPDAYDALCNICTLAEIQFIGRISRYISYKSGLLKQENGKAVTAELIAGEWNYDKSNVYKYIRSLNKKNLICICKNEGEIQYYINPYIFFKGEYINATLTAMFADPKDRV